MFVSKAHVIPSQCAHWRGNLHNDRILIRKMAEYLSMQGIATPACGLVRNDTLAIYRLSSNASSWLKASIS